MVSLKLNEECEQVFLGASLVNPSTGESTIVDAKIDTGAIVSLFPISSVSDMGLEIIGEQDLAMANGDLLHTYICLCEVRLTDDDSFYMPIYACKSTSPVSLIGMDILQQCNFTFLHEWQHEQHSINFTLEVAQKPVQSEIPL